MNTAEKILETESYDILTSQQLNTFAPTIKTVSNKKNYLLEGSVLGPENTPYEGGTFIFNIHVSNMYPICPPMIRFTTKIWHPNISHMTGLTNLVSAQNWNDKSNLFQLFVWITDIFLLYDKFTEPYSMAASNQCKKNRQIFIETAEYWTYVFAGGSKNNSEMDDKVRKIKKYKLNSANAIVALSISNWNIDNAKLLIKHWRKGPGLASTH